MHNVTIKEHIKGRKVFSFSTMVYGSESIIKPKHKKKQMVVDEDIGEDIGSKALRRPPDEERIKKVSLSRTIQKINDIVHSNHWEYFITITLDKERIDRYNYDEIRQRIAKQFQNIRTRKAPSMEYILVPELHKDGAFHFHGLIRNTGSIQFQDSNRKVPSSGICVFNMPDFSYGYNTATPIADTQKASTYITKYITKELNDHLPPNAKRYWCTKGLDKTIKTNMYLTPSEVDFMKKCIKKDTVSAKTVSIDNGYVKFNVEYIITQEKEVDNTLTSDIL